MKRSLAAAVAAATLATSAPFLAPAAAHAAPRPERREHVKPRPPGKIPGLLRADTTPGVRPQGVSTT
jgi:Spy/CpxP family protein refolding chaperone